MSLNIEPNETHPNGAIEQIIFFFFNIRATRVDDSFRMSLPGIIVPRGNRRFAFRYPRIIVLECDVLSLLFVRTRPELRLSSSFYFTSVALITAAYRFPHVRSRYFIAAVCTRLIAQKSSCRPSRILLIPQRSCGDRRDSISQRNGKRRIDRCRRNRGNRL